MSRLFASLAFAAAALSLRGGPPDPVRGQRLFGACAVCHDTGRENKTGPGLFRIVGRRAGTAPGFRYSRAMKRSRVVWSAACLEAYLADPQAFIPGNLMPFSGLPDEAARRDLIAYLKTLK